MNAATEHTTPTTDPRVERTREAIVDAGAELLIEDGPDAITHANVATAARVSRTTAYKHFPTRTALLSATLAAIHEHERSIEALTGDLRTDLLQLAHKLADDLSDDRRTALMVTVMERAQHDPTVREVRAEMIDQLRPMFEDLIARAVGDGVLRHGIDATDALASIAGSLMFRRLMLDEPVDGDTAERLVDAFFHAHAP